MKIRGRKGTKVIVLLLCQCMAIGMFSMNVYAGNVPNNVAGSTVVVNEGEVMESNYGTIEINEGNVLNNYGTIEINENNVLNNYGSISSNNDFVDNNYGTVGSNGPSSRINYNFGTVGINNGIIDNQYRKVTIDCNNPDYVVVMGNVFSANSSLWMNKGSTAPMRLTPISGYHFENQPIAEGCNVIQNGASYEISMETVADDALVISFCIVQDSAPTPDPAPTPDSDEVFLESQIAKIEIAKAGDTVVIEGKCYHSYPLWFMKELQQRRDITVMLSYQYKEMEYEVVIPSNQMFIIEDSIPWYGPLKLAEMFGAVITTIEQ